MWNFQCYHKTLVSVAEPQPSFVWLEPEPEPKGWPDPGSQFSVIIGTFYPRVLRFHGVPAGLITLLSEVLINLVSLLSPST